MEGKKKNGFDGHTPLRPQPTPPTPRLRLVGHDTEQPAATPLVAGGQGRGDWQNEATQANNEVGMPTIVAALLVAAAFGAVVMWMVMR